MQSNDKKNNGERLVMLPINSFITLQKIFFTLVFFSIVLLASSPIANAAVGDGTWQDISNTVSINRSNPLRSRRSPDAKVSVSVENSSSADLTGPFRLVVSNLTSDGVVSISNATGMTEAGDPYFDLTAYVAESFIKGTTSDVVQIIVAGGGKSIFAFTPLIEQWQKAAAVELSVKITSPETLGTVGASPIAIQGTISDTEAALTLNGVSIEHTNGGFSANVALQEGHNTVLARVVSTEGKETTDSISVALDTTPPFITIQSPEDNKIINVASIAVSGLVNDIVRGTVSEDQAAVVVNGKTATVSNRSYLAENISLAEGENTITVTGSDEQGNTASKTITVTYVLPVAKRVELVSGQSQTAKILSVLPEPLKVKLVDGNGEPVADNNVVYRVIQGDGVAGAGSDDEGQGVLTKTDAEGIASINFKLGSRSGQGNHRVRAKAVGFDGEVVFYASAETNPGNKVSINSGNNQRGAPNQSLPQPLIVAVTDSGANLVHGAKVEYKVTKGGGKFQNGNTTYIATTDSDGRATASLTLGETVGLDVHRVSATLVGTTLNAGFTASALQPADPGLTSITGLVLDNQDNPLPNVTIRIDGSNRQAVTDSQGQFKITEAPVGPVHLIVDGSTTTNEGEWPTLSYNLVTIAGAENPLSAPVYMVKLDTENSVYVGKDDKVLTLKEVPGFKLEVKKDSVTFPDGAREGFLSVTPVNASKIPMAPPNGMQPQFIVTIQPAGAKFDPPAPLTLPNVDGHLPGAQVEMYSFDHDLEEFVAIGLGTVSTDGSLIKTNVGVGVIKAGWHCGSQPGGSGCANSCQECQKCDGDCNCVDDDSQTPSSSSNGDCKKTVCKKGAVSEEVDNTDVPADVPGDCKSSAVCVNGSPSSQDDNSDVPDDTQGDCKKATCLNGSPSTENDDTDEPADDKCKSCKDGALVSIPDEPGVTDSLDFSGIKNFIIDINKVLDVFGVPKKEQLPVVTLKFSIEDKKVCCPSSGAMTKEKKYSGQLGFPRWGLEWRPQIPPYTGDYTVTIFGRSIGVAYGLEFTAGLAGSVNVDKAERECTNDNCWGGGLGFGGTFTAGLFGEVPNPALPNNCGNDGDRACAVLRIAGNGATGVNVQAGVDCQKISGKIGIGGLTANAEFIAAEGTWVETKLSKSFPIFSPFDIPLVDIALP